MVDRPPMADDRVDGDEVEVRRVRELQERLASWVRAGLISKEQAEAIGRFEAGPGTAGPDRDRRTLAAEAVGYVGAALAVGAVGLLLEQVWEQLAVGGRLTLVALLTLLLGGGGLALRRTGSPPMQRLTSVLFSGAVIGLGWFAVELGDEVLRLREADLALLVGASTTALALPLYLLRRRALPQLTLLATLSVTAGALLFRPALEPGPTWVGLSFWSLGVAWALLGAGGWLPPARVAEVVGSVLALFALQVGSVDARLGMLVLGVLSAGALVAVAVTTDRGHHLAVGAVGLFVLVPQLVFEIFGDAIGAPATLLVIGLLLVLLAVGVGRVRREVGGDGPSRARDRVPSGRGGGDAT